LDSKAKELLELVVSIALYCNDCITYHVIWCVQKGLVMRSFEALNVALVVDELITDPYIRRTAETLDQ